MYTLSSLCGRHCFMKHWFNCLGESCADALQTGLECTSAYLTSIRVQKFLARFSSSPASRLPLWLDGQQIKRVRQQRYLGFIIDDRINWLVWTHHLDAGVPWHYNADAAARHGKTHKSRCCACATCFILQRILYALPLVPVSPPEWESFRFCIA